MKKGLKIFAVLAAVLSLAGCNNNLVSDAKEYCEITVAQDSARTVITPEYDGTSVTTWTLTATDSQGNTAGSSTDADSAKLVISVLKDNTYTFNLVGTVKSGTTTGTVSGTIADKLITEDVALSFTVKPVLATDTTDATAKGVAEIVIEEIAKDASVGTTAAGIARIKGINGNATGKEYNPTFTIDGNKLTFSEEIPTGVYSVSIKYGEDYIRTKYLAVEAGLKTTVPYTQNEVDAFKLSENKLEPKYLAFVSSKSFKLSTVQNGWNGTLEYSADGLTWTEWNTTDYNGQSAYLEKAAEKLGSETNSKYYLFLRGNNDYLGNSSSNYTNFKINSSDLVDCYGNIMTLLKYSEPDSATITDYSFYSLYYYCKKLRTAPDLPAETLAKGCYFKMFYYCTELKFLSIPTGKTSALPATTLAESCYNAMFQSCEKLETAPALNANKVFTYSYAYMFSECIALKSAPDLPATTLAKGCYASMFLSCKELTTAPNSLPAEELSDNCYDAMFRGCLKLNGAPNLPAKTLVSQCYDSMFLNCKLLKTAPTISATKYAHKSCNSMFYDCISLTTVPELKVTELADECCKQMFYGCSSLKISNSSGTKFFTVPSKDGTSTPVYNMFKGTGGSFTDDPAAETTYYYY